MCFLMSEGRTVNNKTDAAKSHLHKLYSTAVTKQEHKPSYPLNGIVHMHTFTPKHCLLINAGTLGWYCVQQR